MPAEIPDDLQRLMARAFDRAWERFARPGMAIDIAVMRAELARCIALWCARARGTNDGCRLRGFFHLASRRLPTQARRLLVPARRDKT